MHKLLLLEDELEIGKNLQMILKREGYIVDLCDNGDDAVEHAITNNYNLMILDVMLKGGSISSGLEVARIVTQTKKTPYILLTSRAESYDIMLGLDSGAEDYITKPYDLSVLLARVRAVLRREAAKNDTGDSGVLKFRDITLNLITHKVTVRDQPVQLSNQLFELLHYLMKNQKKIVSREELYRNIWGYEHGRGTDTNTLEVNIRRLRHHIGSEYITTVRGKGYVLE